MWCLLLLIWIHNYKKFITLFKVKLKLKHEAMNLKLCLWNVETETNNQNMLNLIKPRLCLKSNQENLNKTSFFIYISKEKCFFLNFKKNEVFPISNHLASLSICHTAKKLGIMFDSYFDLTYDFFFFGEGIFFILKKLIHTHYDTFYKKTTYKKWSFFEL